FPKQKQRTTPLFASKSANHSTTFPSLQKRRPGLPSQQFLPMQIPRNRLPQKILRTQTHLTLLSVIPLLDLPKVGRISIARLGQMPKNLSRQPSTLTPNIPRLGLTSVA